MITTTKHTEALMVQTREIKEVEKEKPDSSARFVRDLSSYLVDYELTETDKKKISSMFLRHQETVIIREPQYRMRTQTPRDPRPKSTRTGGLMGKPNLSPQGIIDYVADKFNLAEFNKMRTRRGQYPFAKFMAMVLMDKCTHLTLKEIGSHFASPYTKGHIDHTTVIHALREGRNLIDTIPYYADIYFEFLNLNNIEHDNPNRQTKDGISGDTGLPGKSL